MGKFLAIAALLATVLPGCVNGIPPPDGWEMPKPKPCDKKVNDVCMTNDEFLEWRRRNGI